MTTTDTPARRATRPTASRLPKEEQPHVELGAQAPHRSELLGILVVWVVVYVALKGTEHQGAPGCTDTDRPAMQRLNDVRDWVQRRGPGQLVLRRRRSARSATSSTLVVLFCRS